MRNSGRQGEDDSMKGLGGNQRRVLAIIDEPASFEVTEKIRPFGDDGTSVTLCPNRRLCEEYVIGHCG